MTDRSDVAAGLSKEQKEIAPKWFYDRSGSELFEAITRSPEYYLARAERGLLTAFAPGLIADLEPATLVELGAGAAAKTRILLDAMSHARAGERYVPIDISSEFLEHAAAGLREDYPGLRVTPVTADMTAALPIPADLLHPVLIAFLGGTIGNFDPPDAIDLLGRVRSVMHRDDRFLVGVDLEKDPELLNAAYNDAEGLTASFNLNVLRVLNRELGADFDSAGFRHHAFYNIRAHRIEMHLVARRAMTVTIPAAGSFDFRPGESLRTELSYKYDRQRLVTVFDEAGLLLERWIVGQPGFALALGSRR